jgi:hypothetical protein
MTRRKARPGSKKFNQKKEVRALARERIGVVKPAQVMVPKTKRKKPKYKERLDLDVVKE